MSILFAINQESLESFLLLNEYFDSLQRRAVQRSQWQPVPVLFPGKSHRWRSLVGCSPWGREVSDMTERLHVHFSLSCIREGNGNPLQCSYLEDPQDGGAWWAAVLWGHKESDTTEETQQHQQQRKAVSYIFSCQHNARYMESTPKFLLTGFLAIYLFVEDIKLSYLLLDHNHILTHCAPQFKTLSSKIPTKYTKSSIRIFKPLCFQ